MVNEAKKLNSANEGDSAANSSDQDGQKPARHILKRPVVATNRKNVVTLMQQVMDEMGVKGGLSHVTSGREAKESFEAQPQSLLFVDWQMGPDIAIQILKLGRDGEHGINPRPIILLIPNVTAEIVAIALEYCVTKVFAGQITAPSLTEQVEHVKRIQETDRSVGKQLEVIAQARKSGDQAMVGEMTAELHEQHPNDLRVTVEFAECLIEAGQWAKAESLLYPLSNREPPYLRAISAYSRCLMKKGAIGDAESALKKAKLINPYDVERLIELGDVLLSGGKVEEAQENFSKASQLDKTNKEAKFGKAKCQLLQDDINDALTLIKEVASPRELVSVFNTAAVMASRDKKFEHSIKLYRTASGLVGNNNWLISRLAFNTGLAYRKWDKPAEALQQFERATKADPTFAKAAKIAGALNGSGPSENTHVDELEGSEESFTLSVQDRRENVKGTGAKLTPAEDAAALIEVIEGADNDSAQDSSDNSDDNID